MGEYVALSYCWGLPQANAVLKTEHSTLEQHLKGIAVDRLPKTIREAICVTHGLGFKYIWVDALCILQDDPDDWAHEAAQMGRVYSNAALTIVASRAAGTAEGLLGKQAFHKSHTVPYRNGHVRVREALARQHADFMTLDREPFNNEPINKRAWTLQEAVLSNRAIFFTTSELSWQCNSWRRCECNFGSKQISSDDIGDYRSLRTDVFMGSRTQEDAYTKWDDLVTLLSKRSITYESDRLPALAGLAQQFHEKMATAFNTHDEYLAGIWRGRLPQALLWMVDGETVREVSDADLHFYKPTIWRAPSWSWCSMEAPVTFPPYIDLEPLLEIVSVSIVPRGPDQYGQLESAKMTVRGRHLTDLVARPTSQIRIGSRLWVLCHGNIILGTFSRDIDERDVDEVHCSAVVVGRITLLATYYALVLEKTPGKIAMERVGVAHLGPYFSSNTKIPYGTGPATRTAPSDGAKDIVEAAPMTELVLHQIGIAKR
ncbi:hypothetical protein PRZ48_014763 [Zasmidium cellare]|uniref:Heterokaryon incompatibility domain-containing protein n=1 Tax=Zasmidium cellare TaxID=395010 RepID=A0ABR0DZ98_ZASCE|nr:hypothetical protein PRZ48_014763 [Zasmidium cellare]